ncbi:hypothetical protein FQA39_LY07532 [Lamprigera yunnana]|nr:hypothetical protein FQA39_LY07532 [Lamprigera yunnana]
MADDLKRLISKRSAVKARLSILKKSVMEINVKFNEQTYNENTAMELQLQIGKITNLINKYDDIQLNIELICDEEQLGVKDTLEETDTREDEEEYGQNCDASSTDDSDAEYEYEED